jgi:hypothetical protein
MFSIINVGLAQVLVWFSPGPQTISTLAPPSARPVSGRHAIPGPSLILPQALGIEAVQATAVAAAGSSHTPARSDIRESSHTQEFTVA